MLDRFSKSRLDLKTADWQCKRIQEISGNFRKDWNKFQQISGKVRTHNPNCHVSPYDREHPACFSDSLNESESARDAMIRPSRYSHFSVFATEYPIALHVDKPPSQGQSKSKPIGSGVWGTPANFNGFRVLAALLHGTLVLVVGVSQTLRRWTEGATYIRQVGHHVGHWPTF